MASVLVVQNWLLEGKESRDVLFGRMYLRIVCGAATVEK